MSDPSVSSADLDLGSIKHLLLSYNPASDISLIERAYHFANRAHKGQKRVSGEPYIKHPVEVATILAEHRFDAITLAGALLHDVIEDCGVTEQDIANEFGAELAGIVAGVTKISSLALTRQETQAESIRRMLVAVARDIRVLLIKLADRLHNMRTIDALKEEKIERLSRETLEIYAPLANRMGMSTIRSELEDLSFKHLMPEKYGEVETQMATLLGERKKSLDEAGAVVVEKLAEAGIQANVQSRTKAVYSVYKKMMRQKRPIDEIFDLLAMRILVTNARDCYGALGIIHTIWKPIPRRFKDYIAMPKPNMYQAIHTTVIGPGEGALEIQIKTHAMHLTAEEGIAAHWKYKSDGTVDDRLGWLKHILEWQREAVTAEEFMDSLRIDLYSDQVFILTPKGDIIELPAGSTPIDVAFAIHTEIGFKIAGARVDGRMAPISTRLTSGAVVEILTAPTARPSLDWLDAVRTPRARQKIRHYLKERGSEELRRKGADLLQAAINRARLGVSVAQRSEEIVQLAEEMSYQELETLLEAIGFGSESAEGVTRRLTDKMRAKPVPMAPAAVAKPGKGDGGPASVVVEGIGDLVIRFGKCCNPVPGDAIIGYLSRGRGVSIHRANCPNAMALSGETARFVNASWVGRDGRFAASIEVQGGDRIGLLADLTAAIAKEGGNITLADVRTREVGRDLFVVEVTSADHLEKILNALRSVQGVQKVTRASPR